MSFVSNGSPNFLWFFLLDTIFDHWYLPCFVCWFFWYFQVSPHNARCFHFIFYYYIMTIPIRFYFFPFKFSLTFFLLDWFRFNDDWQNLKNWIGQFGSRYVEELQDTYHLLFKCKQTSRICVEYRFEKIAKEFIYYPF